MFKSITKILCILALGGSTSVIASPTNHHKSKISSKKSIHKKVVIKNKVKVFFNSKSTKSSKKLIAYNRPSNSFLSNIKYSVFNYENGTILEESAPDTKWPIASLTKLMTAYVFVNNIPDIQNCSTIITDADTDYIKRTHTRLAQNKEYECQNLLEVMLIASDNYAASALSRAIPGWTKQTFIKNMNMQAKKWWLFNTTFVDSSGLSPNNQSSVDDYRKLTINVVKNNTISKISGETYASSKNSRNQTIFYKNSNKLVREKGFDVNLSKTGYIHESGYNLVHLADCSTPIGVVEFGAKSSEQRANFVKQKLSKYGCS